MGFKELWFLIKKYFPLEFSASVSPIITLEMQNVVRITWAKKGECCGDSLYRRVHFSFKTSACACFL